MLMNRDFDKTVDDLQKLNFEMGCTSMVFTVERRGESTEFCGRGFIFPSKDGVLKFKVILDDDPQPLLDYLGRIETMSFLDLDGTEWSSDSVYVQSVRSKFMTGELLHFACTSPSAFPPEYAAFSLAFFSDAHIPTNSWTKTKTTIADRPEGERRTRNVWTLNACGCDFVVTGDEAVLKLNCHSGSGELPDKIENRVVEALEFVLAKPLKCVLMQKNAGGVETICIRGWNLALPGIDFFEPLVYHSGGREESVAKLFAKYLAYILTHKEDDRHPISREINAIQRASIGSVYDQGLILATAIESVLSQEYPLADNADGNFKENVKKLIKHVEAWEGDESIQRRATGTLGAMHHIRAKDRLWMLVKEGVIIEKQIGAWDRLRNIVVHPTGAKQHSIQELQHLNRAVTVLFYHLIFNLIGYEGEYNDYAIDRSPVRIYPASLEQRTPSKKTR